MKLLLAATSLALCAAPAAADVLYLGSSDGVVRSGDPETGVFSFLAVCGGPIHSLTTTFDGLFIGDTDGSIYHFDETTGFVDYSFQAGNDATALLMLGGQLLIGGSDGTVQWVDPSDGTVLQSQNVGGPVGAMTLVDARLFVGTTLGVVFTSDLAGGPFSFWGTCGGPIHSMSHDSTHVQLGTTGGVVYRIDRKTQLVDGAFTAPNDVPAMVKHAGDLLVGGTDATVQRIHRVSGATKTNVTTSFSVDAMALEVDQGPGFAYCYGFEGACPCGNMDGEAGCANSEQVGAMLLGRGTASVTADDLELTGTNLPTNKNARFYMGAATVQSTFGDGLFCAGSGGYGVRRFPVFNSGANGTGELRDIAAWAAQNFPPQNQILTGFNWNFQIWYRDPAGPCGGTINTTNAYSVTFVP